jgi:hypothetical protein
MTMWSPIAYLRRRTLKGLASRILKDIEAGVFDAFLEMLLRAMRLAFLLDPEYRKSIEGFDARYVFETEDGGVAVSAIFARDKMKVKGNAVDDSNVRVTFRDGGALMRFLFRRNPDIIAAILDNEVTYEGNLNYLARFAYMAKSLQLRLQI